MQVRFDMRGHGRSGKPATLEGYSSRDYADDFNAVVKAFELQKPVLVGWSLGGQSYVSVRLSIPHADFVQHPWHPILRHI
jgi:pimeloyl-ACP methyl ester carboxylesterase